MVIAFDVPLPVDRYVDKLTNGTDCNVACMMLLLAYGHNSDRYFMMLSLTYRYRGNAYYVML